MGINKIVFPQADSVNKIIIILTTFDKKDLTNSDLIMKRFNIVYRQTQYYIEALRFLGVIDFDNKLTPLGKKLTSFEKGNFEMCIVLRNAIINRPVFKETYVYYQKNGQLPSREYIANLISENFFLTGQTCYRRSQTVINWIQWAVDVL